MSGPLAHRVDGDGPPLLLLNGGMMTIAAWEPVAARLAASMRVIRCDFRGQLLSPGVPQPDLGAHVADVVALLDHLGLPSVHVAGTSFGAEVGLLLAATRPERVRSLLVAAAVDRPSDGMLAWGRALVAACRHALATGDRGPFFDAMLPEAYSPAFIAANRAALATRRELFQATPDAYFEGGVRLLEAIERMELAPRLADVRCPVFVLAAEHDTLMPFERTAALAAAIPGARLEVVAGAGHALVVERPEAFLAACTAFIAQVESTPDAAAARASREGEPR